MAIAKLGIQHFGRGSGAGFLELGPAKLIAGLLETPGSLRGSFDYSAMPILCDALNAKDTGRSLFAQFVSANGTLCDIVRLIAAVIEVEIDVVCANPFLRTDDRPFDAEVCMSPFGSDIRDREALPQSTLHRIGASETGRLQHEPVAFADALVHAPGAQVVLGVSPSALFRTVGAEAAAREEVISSGRLAAVFGVPPGMFYATTRVLSALVVLTPEGEHDGDVRFINLSDEHFSKLASRGRYEAREDVSWVDARKASLDKRTLWARDVPRAEVAKQNHVLTPERYLQARAAKTLSSFLEDEDVRLLKEVAEIIRPRALPKDENSEHIIREAGPGDIAETGFLSEPSKEIRLAQGGMRAARNQRLRPGDLVFSAKGTIGRIGIIPEDVPGEDEPFWTAGQSLVILRPLPRIRPEVLFEYLTNETVQEHIRSLAGGAAMLSIAAKDLAEFRVPLPSQERQVRVVDAFRERQDRYAEIERLRMEIEAERGSTWPHRELAG
ncbi:type I restriction-modification system subunit M/S [Jannaschia sp. W003]|uniref:type I restriction-modification system subunit M/S n=1 Tax=Jannaschia sp. W003 TaxID=2867012 RepID=UPI0021A69763|nr:type I restriction-modification system subunit M/S [Jannaschia sp. W003]UWQ20121.1 restriction endonuclease subunit S [Jannaschia sp. W003]